MSLADDVLEGAPGTVSEFAGITLPPGYLWANGQAVSRSSYGRLFAALTSSLTGTTASGSASVSSASQDLTQLPTSIVGAPISGAGIPAGTTVSAVTSTTITLSQNATAAGSGVSIVIAPHGVGDGSTTFNVPDRRGRAGIGHDAMGTTAAGRVTSAAGGVNGTLLGASGGAQTHTLSTAEMPAHTHTATDAGHAHGYNVAVPAAGQTGGGAYTAETGNTGSTTNTGYASITIGSQGGGGAHTIMQPSIVMNYIVKT